MCEHGCWASHTRGTMAQTLDLGNCGVVRLPWEGSYGSKLMSRRTERPYKVDGAGELARHSAARCSTPEINGPVVQQKFTFLLRETCNPVPLGAAARNGRRAGAGVSRGHSTESNEPGRPDGLTTREGLN